MQRLLQDLPQRCKYKPNERSNQHLRIKVIHEMAAEARGCSRKKLLGRDQKIDGREELSET